jgi:hypothetical protein
MTKGLAYTSPNPICEIMIAKKIFHIEYCFIDMIVAWPGHDTQKINANRVEKNNANIQYMRFAYRTAPIPSARILPTHFR